MNEDNNTNRKTDVINNIRPMTNPIAEDTMFWKNTFMILFKFGFMYFKFNHNINATYILSFYWN